MREAERFLAQPHQQTCIAQILRENFRKLQAVSTLQRRRQPRYASNVALKPFVELIVANLRLLALVEIKGKRLQKEALFPRRDDVLGIVPFEYLIDENIVEARQ